jgi:hypothetical protein
LPSLPEIKETTAVLYLKKLTATIMLGLGASMCFADEADSKSAPKVSLVAFLQGDAMNPVLHIRLCNTDDVPIVVDKELVFLPKIALVDNEKRAIAIKKSRAIEKPDVPVLKSRLVTLKAGEVIERQVDLRKGFKHFVTGIGTPVQSGGSEAPKVMAYETYCQMPTDARPVEIYISFYPWYSFEEGFAQYLDGVDASQFFRGPLHVNLSYAFGEGTKESPGAGSSCSAEGATKRDHRAWGLKILTHRKTNPRNELRRKTSEKHVTKFRGKRSAARNR